MNGEFLLDTNTAIRLLSHDQAVEDHFRARPEVLLPVFALGELYYGAQKSRKVQENCQKVDMFAARVEILGADIGTAREFGKIKNELRLKGRMIPVNDLWIASSARQHDLTVVSDDRHFAEVENLRWEQW